MTEHLLHAAQIGAALEQMCRERVSEQVGVHPFGLEAGLLGKPSQDQEGAGPRERATAGVEEQIGTVAPVQMGPTEREVTSHRLDRGSPERNDSLLVPLADHAHRACIEVDGALRGSDRFGDPQSRPVEELDQRPVAHGSGRHAGRGLDQPFGLGWGESAGECARPPGKDELRSGVVRALAEEHEVAEEGAERRRAPSDGRRGKSVCPHLGDPALELFGGRLGEQPVAECPEGGQVAPVGIHRPRRALRGEEEQETLGVGV